MAALLGADRLISALRNLWRLKREGTAAWDQAAEEYVTEKRARERWLALAAKSDEILALLKPNAGASVKDAVTRIEAKQDATALRLEQAQRQLEAHVEDSRLNVEVLHQLKARLDAHIALSLDGGAD